MISIISLINVKVAKGWVCVVLNIFLVKTRVEYSSLVLAEGLPQTDFTKYNTIMWTVKSVEWAGLENSKNSLWSCILGWQEYGACRMPVSLFDNGLTMWEPTGWNHNLAPRYVFVKLGGQALKPHWGWITITVIDTLLVLASFTQAPCLIYMLLSGLHSAELLHGRVCCLHMCHFNTSSFR